MARMIIIGLVVFLAAKISADPKNCCQWKLECRKGNVIDPDGSSNQATCDQVTGSSSNVDINSCRQQRICELKKCEQSPGCKCKDEPTYSYACIDPSPPTTESTAFTATPSTATTGVTFNVTTTDIVRETQQTTSSTVPVTSSTSSTTPATASTSAVPSIPASVTSSTAQTASSTAQTASSTAQTASSTATPTTRISTLITASGGVNNETPVKDQLKGKGQTGDSKIVPIAIGIPLALLTTVIIAVVVACVIGRRRRRQANERKQPRAIENKSYGDRYDVIHLESMETPSSVTNLRSSLSDSGFSDHQEPEENIYHEPENIDPNLHGNSSVGQGHVPEDEYNRIRFNDKEVVMDPNYGSLDLDRIPKRDPQYAHVQENVLNAKSNLYSHTVELDDGKNRNTDTDEKQTDNCASNGLPRTGSGLYNHLGVENFRHKDPDSDNLYSRLNEKTQGLPTKTKTNTSNVIAYSNANKPSTSGSIDGQEHLDTTNGYELAKPIPSDQGAAPSSSGYYCARPFPDDKQAPAAKGNGYEIAKPFPEEPPTVPRRQSPVYELSQSVVEPSNLRHRDTKCEHPLVSDSVVSKAPTFAVDEIQEGKTSNHSYFILEPVKNQS